MDFPDSVWDEVKASYRKYPDDIPASVREAETRIRRLPEYSELVAMLVTSSVQQLIYDARHQSNGVLRRAAGVYGGPAKVTDSGSNAVQRVYASYYSYCIDGRTLGMIKGAELADIADNEESTANGHHFNARLCRRLAAMVPADKLVKDVVTERKLKGLFRDEGERDDPPELKSAARKTKGKEEAA